MRMLKYISFIINQKYFILFIILIQRLDSQKIIELNRRKSDEIITFLINLTTFIMQVF
jgi:hypothetical protein